MHTRAVVARVLDLEPDLVERRDLLDLAADEAHAALEIQLVVLGRRQVDDIPRAPRKLRQTAAASSASMRSTRRQKAAGVSCAAAIVGAASASEVCDL